ncbi:MAG: NAD(P)-dependent oxidoreductase [Simkaniaceae bacterium]|nr:NAD(P)-dependent oxidoreductase [Candidatus Sacchlamyda saccharinae]
MKVLITGSKGLVGSALSSALHALNIDVVGVDNRAEIGDPEYGDILDENCIYPLADRVDGIVHLAAISRVIDGEKNPQLCWSTNVDGTAIITDSALTSSKKPWVIYASSREVYGQPETFPVKETAPLIPVNIYGKSKCAAEAIVEKAKEKGLRGSIVRFSNVFGSVNDYPDRVIPAFCRAAAEGNPIRVDGESNLFDFTYLEDVLQGILSIIRLLSQHDQPLPPIHLTSGAAVSLGQIAQIAKLASPYSIKIYEEASRSYDVSQFWGDTTRARELLNWQACVNVTEGMHRLINQFRLSNSSNQLLEA